jgi:hypothetical protein
MPNPNPNRHRQKYPERKKPVQERELLSLHRSAPAALRRNRGHEQTSQHGSDAAAGKGAPSSAYLAGEQQAFASQPGGRLAVSDIALKAELPEAISRSMAAYVGCIAGAIPIEDYRAGLLAAGFQHVEIVDSGSDLNAYAKVENQSGCCSPAMAEGSCCSPAPGAATLHQELSELLSKYDVNAAAASVKVYALKPGSNAKQSAPCCAPGCCS